MEMTHKPYSKSLYDTICNQARWEWLVFDPGFDNDSSNRMGVWFCTNSDEWIGLTMYDHYFGETHYVVKKGYEELEMAVKDLDVDSTV